MLVRSLAVIITFLLLSACSTQSLRHSVHLDRADELGDCAKLFERIDKRVLAAKVADVQSARVPGFPYFRTNRLLATFNEGLSTQTMPEWFAQMRQLDKEARHFELQNIPLSGMEQDMEEKLDLCATLLIQADIADPLQVKKLSEVARVADSYIQANRILGLYAVTRLFVSRGVRQLQAQIKTTFSRPADELVSRGQLIAFAPAQEPLLNTDRISMLISKSSNNGLSMPLFDESDKHSLFSHFAPVWQLDVLDSNDIFGVPAWSDDEKITVRTGKQQVYRHLSFVRLHNKLLPQFNYTIWFPSRPPASAFDILAGNLDGITWRVTVGLDGQVLMYDVMHNCGCYHMFFPPAGINISIKKAAAEGEPVLVPQQAPALQKGQRLHLHVASGSHYVEALSATTTLPEYRHYGFADYGELRSMSMKKGGRKSMFGPTGIVPGTSRKERWLLWPMGVEDAGAMRQWGQHATAFVGRRHFDDADLLERYFNFP